MKKPITILWIIIVIGLGYLTYEVYSSPENQKPKDDPIEVVEDIEMTEEIEEPEPEVIEEQEKIVRENPKSVNDIFRLGQIYLANNEPTKAAEQFKKALEIKPSSQTIKLSLGRAHLNSRALDIAKSTIFELDQKNLNVKYYRAILEILSKNFNEAKNLFEEFELDAEKHPQLAEKAKYYLDAFEIFSYYKEGDTIFLELLLAKAMVDSKEYDAAIPLLFDVISQKQNYRDAWIVLGHSYLNTDKFPDARDALLQAETLDSEKPETLFFLGLAYAELGENDSAIKYIEKADKNGYEPKDHINLKLGDLYLLNQDHKKSAQKYENILNTNKKNIDVYTRLVWLNIDKNEDYNTALHIALEAVEVHPDKAMSYNLVGWAYTVLEDYDKAKRNLDKAVAMSPNFDAAHLNLGLLYEKKGAVNLASEYYKRAYIYGAETNIGNLAAMRFNKLTLEISKPTRL